VSDDTKQKLLKAYQDVANNNNLNKLSNSEIWDLVLNALDE
jgi:hypothetical protein